jgi:hypothetical protein
MEEDCMRKSIEEDEDGGPGGFSDADSISPHSRARNRASLYSLALAVPGYA